MKSLGHRMSFLGKKGFFFTVLAIIIVGIFTIIFSVKPYSPEESQNAIDSRVLLMNSFTHELKTIYLERVLRSTAKSTLKTMTEYISITSQRFALPQNVFSTLITSGTMPSYTSLTRQYDNLRFKILNNYGVGVIDFGSSIAVPSTVWFGGKDIIVQRFNGNLILPNYITNISLYFGAVSGTPVYIIFYDNQSNFIASADFIPRSNTWNNIQFDEPIQVTKGNNSFILASPLSAPNGYGVGRCGSYSCYYPSYRYFTGTSDYGVHYGRAFTFASTTPSGDLGIPLESFIPQLSMRGKTLDHFSKKISKLSTENLKINTKVSLSNVSIVHHDPWNLNISADVKLFTQRLDTSFDIKARISTLLSIEWLENPIYAQYNLTAPINKTNITQWNLEKMKAFMFAKHYRLNDEAPSFFMRFGNYLGQSPYGIENIVSLPLSTLGKQPGEHNYSRADWQFFFNVYGKCRTGFELYTLNDPAIVVPVEQFLLDIRHIASFGLGAVSQDQTTMFQLYCPLTQT